MAGAGRCCRGRESCTAASSTILHYVSCTSLIADVARDKFGFDTEPLAELIRWADIVDGARYESAEAAVGMAAPAMKLTMVIEAPAKALCRG